MKVLTQIDIIGLNNRPVRFIIGCTSAVHYMNDKSRPNS